MRVLHIVPYLPKASGVTTFVVECTDELQRIGNPQAVAINDMSCWDVAVSQVGVPRIGIDEGLRGIKSGQWDILHIHGIWPPFMHRFVKAAVSLSVPIVWSLHGMLAPWAFKSKWWKKLPSWWLWQKKDLHQASVLHATTEMEVGWVREHGFGGHFEIIPLGTHLPRQGVGEPFIMGNSERTLLFVGRINPIKALDNLIRAWALLAEDLRCKQWRLHIVGLDDAEYRPFLEELSRKLSVSSMVVFTGPKYGEELENEYRNASALILPSHSENFGGVVIDALAHHLPVIVSTGTPWSEVVPLGCGWQIDNSPSVLASTLREVLSLPDSQLRMMGEKGYRYVIERYTWQSVAKRLKDVYESLC